MIAEIRFLAPENWRGCVKTAEARRLLQAYRPGSLGPDPGTGPYLAKVRLDREWVKGLAELAGSDVSSFLRALLAPRLPSPSAGQPTNVSASRVAVASRVVPQELPVSKPLTATPPPDRTGWGPSPKTQASVATKPVIPTRPANRPESVQAYCSVCGRYQEGIMAGVPQRFQCSVCGGS